MGILKGKKGITTRHSTLALLEGWVSWLAAATFK